MQIKRIPYFAAPAVSGWALGFGLGPMAPASAAPALEALAVAPGGVLRAGRGRAGDAGQPPSACNTHLLMEHPGT